MSPVDERVESEQGLDVRRYLGVLQRRRWIILSVTVLCAATAAFLSLAVITPLYRAETKIVVGQGNSLFEPGAANAVQPFTATMSDLVQSNVVASRVVDSLELAETPESLLESVSVSINPQTAVLEVDVTDAQPAKARAIADEIGRVFSALVAERFGDGPVSTTGESVPPLTATVWDPAHVDPEQVSPRPVRDIGLAIALGLILGVMAAFLRDNLDRRLRDREAVEQVYRAPVIGQIPFPPLRGDGQALAWNGFRPGTESFQSLRANLQFLGVQRPLRSLLITSATAEQGKTTVAANLALALARSGAATVIVEADLRRPRLEQRLGVERGPRGLTAVLVGSANLDDALVPIPRALVGDSAPDGRTAAADFLPSGPLPPNPSGLLASARMLQVLDELSIRYEHVIIDSPPLLPVSDALELAPGVDGVLLVVRRNRARRDEGREVRAMLDRLGIDLVGTIFTDVEARHGYYAPYEDVTPSRRSRRGARAARAR
jgi:receptor protein-tyrosine kinase